MVVFPDHCTGCKRCELVCSFTHFKVMNPARSAIHVIRVGHAPIDAPIFCIQCGLCIDVCPSKAISRDNKTQAVVVDREKCSGCGYCVHVCPFGAVTLDPLTNKAVKCDLCGGDPQCVKFCPENALGYVDSNKAAKIKRYFFARIQEKERRPLAPYPRGG